MAKLSKRARAIKEKIEIGRQYPVEDAFGLLKELSKVKFSESVDVAVNLGVDPRRSDQVVRGSTVLPNGTGKTVRVAVFAQGDPATGKADGVHVREIIQEVGDALAGWPAAAGEAGVPADRIAAVGAAHRLDCIPG